VGENALERGFRLVALMVCVAAPLVFVALTSFGGGPASARSSHTTSAAASTFLTLGFSADPNLVEGTSVSRAPWIHRAVADGAAVVRVNVRWAEVAPAQPPPGFVASNPASPGYNWSALDAVVRQLSARRLKILITIFDAPHWAEGPDPPPGAWPGNWRPNVRQLADFATAIATRYDGRYPAQFTHGGALPRVRLWQAWNEPNLASSLSPQWVHTRQGWIVVGPSMYRGMLNAFYGAVKRISASNYVVMGGLAPYGDPPGTDPVHHERTAPLAFLRDLFCLRAVTLAPGRCPAPVHLDAVDHHPYAAGGPTWHALNPNDIAVPDIHKMVRVLNVAVRDGHVLPRGPKAFWVTELGWSSNPPNPAPKAVPIPKDARWLQDAMYILWRQGVMTILPLEIGDPPVVANYNSVFESGLYFSDGRPKQPMVTAYRFPFVVRTIGRNRVLAWGRTPLTGQLTIDILHGRRWSAVHIAAVSAGQVFAIPVTTRDGLPLRASIGAQNSLPAEPGS
jgi:hypothetical protein